MEAKDNKITKRESMIMNKVSRYEMIQKYRQQEYKERVQSNLSAKIIKKELKF